MLLPTMLPTAACVDDIWQVSERTSAKSTFNSFMIQILAHLIYVLFLSLQLVIRWRHPFFNVGILEDRRKAVLIAKVIAANELCLGRAFDCIVEL